MKKFIVKIIIFLFPIALYFFVPFTLALATRDFFWDIDKVVNKIVSKEKKYLIGFGYYDLPYLYLKYHTLVSLPQMEVVAVGSSRVLQFREEMFESSFYNAGYTVSSIADFKTFLSLIPENKMPEVLIVGLDQWMFNANWDDLSYRKKDPWIYQINPTKINKETFIKSIKIYKDFFDNKIDLHKLFQYNSQIVPVGLNAFMNDTGFRNDGSFSYGTAISSLRKGQRTVNEDKFTSAFERIERGNRRFEHGTTLNIAALAELDSFLKYCQEKKLQVVGFFPPYANIVYATMMDSGNYGYISGLYEQSYLIFAKYNFELYNFPHLSSCGSSDDEAIDGFHGGEKTFLNLLVKILEKKSILNKYCNIKQLKYDSANSDNYFQVYAY